jgi:xylulokinase
MTDSNSVQILAVDLGTGGPKVSLVSAQGLIASTAFEPTPLIHTDDGGVEQDPEVWWTAVTRAARRAVAEAPPGTAAPSAVAVTAQWAATVAVDEDCNPLINAISWMDSRGARLMPRAVGGFPAVQGYNALKIARWIRRTGGAPSLQGHDPIGQILVIADRYPDAHKHAAFFLEPGDFLTGRMTGRIATAPETATLCFATDTRNVEKIDYDDKLLAMGGLKREQMAPIVASGSVVGELLPGRAREMGIDPVPVIASSPDIMSAAIGAGTIGEGEMHLYLGTSAWLSGHVSFKRTDIFHNIATLPSSAPGRYLICTEQQSAGRSLEHLHDSLLAVDDLSYEALLAEADATPPGSEGVIFTPWLNGERTPLDDRFTRASYTNLSLRSTRGALVRATLEGVAMNVRWMHHYTEKLLRDRIDDIALIGGGATSPLWCQIISDVLDRRVRQVAEPRQANTRGAALLAAVALGELEFNRIPDYVQSAESFVPDPSTRGLHDERFKQFQSFYKANRKLFRRINSEQGAT